MDIDLDAGIKKIDVMIEERKAFNYYSQGEFISFCQMKEVLEAMRTKISHICDKCANECKATHLRAECSLYTPKPSQGQDPCEETFETKQSDLNKIYGICVHPACRHKDAEIQLLNKELEITKKLLYIATGEVNNQADKNEKLKNRLAEADDLLNNPNTITIDRKVAENFKEWCEKSEFCGRFSHPIKDTYQEFKRALGEKI